jgi:nucleoid DNA-binding protein
MKRKVKKPVKSNKVVVAKKSTMTAAKKSVVSQKLTKAEIFKTIADDAGLMNKQVKQVFLSLQNLLYGSIDKKGYGEFVIPELAIKVRRVTKAATKKRKGRNPFTGEEVVIPAKPARQVVKTVAMKALKEVVK